MFSENWAEKISTAVTLCDKDGKIIYMNEKSAEVFANDGGYELIGKNLFDCHNENSNKILNAILTEKKPNIYTVEKKGKKKLIYQAPWFKNNELGGLVEFSIELPPDMPHHNRDIE